MKTVFCEAISESVKKTVLDAGIHISPSCLRAMRGALAEETGAARFALDVMLENADIAASDGSPVCQDTGMAVVFVKIGQDVRVAGGFVGDAIEQGVRDACREGFFRKSVLDPLTRENTGDNTPAVIHYEIVPGEAFRVDVLLKGFGSENMSRLFMLSPSDGLKGVEDAIVESVASARGNPCPPVVVGVGVGGTMEKAAVMSKHALLRDIAEENPDRTLAVLEKMLTEKINALGIGPQGFGGKLTCLGVLIETFPTHLAGLPVAVTMQCHAVRHGGFDL